MHLNEVTIDLRVIEFAFNLVNRDASLSNSMNGSGKVFRVNLSVSGIVIEEGKCTYNFLQSLILSS